MSRNASGAKSASSRIFPTNAVLGLAIGVAIGVAGTVYIRPSFDDGRDAAYVEIRSRLAERGIYDAETSGETTFLSGTLVSRAGNVLTVTTAEIPRDPLAPDPPTERTVRVTDDTKLVLLTEKPPAQFEEERESYLQALISLAAEADPETDAPPIGAPAPEEPLPFILEEISLDDLTPGLTLEIHADRDILFEGSFTATEIIATDRIPPSEDDAVELPIEGETGALSEPPNDDAVIHPSDTGPEPSDDADDNPGLETPSP